MRLAAIDIGSNAVRLLISDIIIYRDGTLDTTKVNLVRVPIRLGFDVFETGVISDQKKADLIEVMNAFKHLLQVYGVKHYKVCATSAMRDAMNKESVVEEVFQRTGFLIDVISGSKEAKVLYETHLADSMDAKNYYLYIDVGGGSTELTYYGKGKILQSRSFDIGTIRLLKYKIDDSIWDEMKDYLKETLKQGSRNIAIGSGGNINKVFSISKRKNGKPLTIDILKGFYKELSALTTEERMHKYGFKEDRADVIVPALLVYTNVLRWASIQDIYVPQIGLADGLIRTLYQELSFTSLKAVNK